MKTALGVLACVPVLAMCQSTYSEVRPLIEKHCAGCHHHALVDKPAISGGLALDSFAGLMKGGKRPIVVPRRPADSEIIRRLESGDASTRMPRGMPPLSMAAIGSFRQWIAEGALEGTQAPIVAPSLSTGKAAASPVVQAIDVFIPFGRRKPVEPPETQESRPEKPILDTPGAITIDEDERVEALVQEPYESGLMIKAGPIPPVTAIAFAPDGALLVGTYGRVVLWDLAQRAVINELTGMAGAVNSLLFSPDRKLLSIGGGKPFAGGEVRLYDAGSFQLVNSMAAHKEVILSQAFSPDSKRLATSSYDRTAEIWDISQRQRLASIKDHSDAVQAVAFGTDGKTLATAGMDRIVKLSDGITGKGFLTINPELKGIMAIAFSPDGKFLVTSGESPEIRWWDATSIGDSVSERGWIPARKMPGHSSTVNDLRFSPDGKLLASASMDRTVRLWSAGSGRLVRTLMDADALIYSVAFSPDSNRLAAAGADGLTRVWDVRTGRLELILAHKGVPGSPAEWIAVEPDGRHSASQAWRALAKERKVDHAKKN